MVWGLGAYSKGQADRVRDTRALRAENARLYADYIQLNPDVSAAESDKYASSLAGDSELMRSQLPSVEAMKSRVQRRQAEVAAAASSRETAKRRALQDEVGRASEVMGQMMVGSKDNKTAIEQFGKAGNGIWSSAILSPDGSVSSAVTALGQANAIKTITPQVNAAQSVWAANPIPDKYQSQVLNTVTNQDLVGSFKNMGAQLTENRRQSLQAAVPTNSKKEANSADVLNANANDVAWQSEVAKLKPYFSEGEIEDIKGSSWQPEWGAFTTRQSDEMDRALKSATAAAESFYGNPENLAKVTSEEDLYAQIYNSMSKDLSPLNKINGAADLPSEVKGFAKTAWNTLRNNNVVALNAQEEATILEKQQAELSGILVNEKINKDRTKVVDALASQWRIISNSDSKMSEKDKAIFVSNVENLVSTSNDVAASLNFDISADNYYNNLLSTISRQADIEFDSAVKISSETVIKAMFDIANRTRQADDIDTAMRTLGVTDFSTQVIDDPERWEEFGNAMRMAIAERIRVQNDVIPNDWGKGANAPSYDDLGDLLSQKAQEITEEITGRNGFMEAEGRLQKANASKSVVGIEQELERGNEYIAAAQDAMEELVFFEQQATSLINGNVLPMTMEQKAAAREQLRNVLVLKQNLNNAVTGISSEMRIMARNKQSLRTADRETSWQASSTQMTSELTNLSQQNMPTKELRANVEQLVDKVIEENGLNRLLVTDYTMEGEERAWKFADIMRKSPAVSGLMWLNANAPIKARQDDLRNTLLRLAEKEVGLTTQGQMRRDDASGLTLGNLFDEIGQGLTVVGDIIVGAVNKDWRYSDPE